MLFRSRVRGGGRDEAGVEVWRGADGGRGGRGRGGEGVGVVGGREVFRNEVEGLTVDEERGSFALPFAGGRVGLSKGFERASRAFKVQEVVRRGRELEG